MSRTAAVVAAEAIAGRLNTHAPVAAVSLGSGFAGVATALDDARSAPCGEFEGFPPPTVAGHAGRIVAGRLGGREVLLFDGRAHVYEGHGAPAAAFSARVAHTLGASVLVLGNAAGGIRSDLEPGDVLVTDDHLNLSFRNPLVGPLVAGDERFPDMSAPYDVALTAALETAMRSAGLRASRGVYACVLGPSYETPAEIDMLQRLGADAVGMSTVPEVIAARALRMHVVAFSVIANRAPGRGTQALSHADVLRAVDATAPRLIPALADFVARI